ncbi:MULTISPECIES: hypothetical protein [unclassified Lysobacter]|uniref:hypothetical protein n=1 Tax=unclassified Lysobacter TaxID=2635362 RepID=UPI0006FC7408|nr:MULTISPECIES: hypothetical protein [unclassified Lysobacter]KRC33996.1 hypothetical protein ASE10_13775 [Lysobacter sp. Root76]KRD69330.1 hypothetical protein ASE45_09215 [Lysobacter sp. Root96]
MRHTHRLSLLIALGLCAISAPALAGDAIQDCVDLSGSQQVSRFGTQYVLVADGDTYYRLSVGSSCDGLPLATRFELSADGQGGRICPTGTRVKTNNANCKINAVERIDAGDYARYTKRR